MENQPWLWMGVKTPGDNRVTTFYDLCRKRNRATVPPPPRRARKDPRLLRIFGISEDGSGPHEAVGHHLQEDGAHVIGCVVRAPTLAP